MKRTIQVRIFRAERQYVAECLDLPVVTEALTLDELTDNIEEAISLHSEGENLEELGIAAKSDRSGYGGTSPCGLMPRLWTLSSKDLLHIFGSFGFVRLRYFPRDRTAALPTSTLSNSW